MLDEGFSSPTPYSRPNPPSTASPEDLSKAVEFMISKVNWASQRFVWAMAVGLACCAVVMMQTGDARYDLDSSNSLIENRADTLTNKMAPNCMIVVGTLTNKMAPAL